MRSRCLRSRLLREAGLRSRALRPGLRALVLRALLPSWFAEAAVRQGQGLLREAGLLRTSGLRSGVLREARLRSGGLRPGLRALVLRALPSQLAEAAVR